MLNEWWLPESGNASGCSDVLTRRFVSDFASVWGFFDTLLEGCCETMIHRISGLADQALRCGLRFGRAFHSTLLEP